MFHSQIKQNNGQLPRNTHCKPVFCFGIYTQIQIKELSKEKNIDISKFLCWKKINNLKNQTIHLIKQFIVVL